MNLTNCPEGGEHKWELWTSEEQDQIRIDCDRCSFTVFESPLRGLNLDISPLPIEVMYNGDTTMIGQRGE